MNSMSEFENLTNDTKLKYFLDRNDIYMETRVDLERNALGIIVWSGKGFKCLFVIPFIDLIEVYHPSILAERLLRALEHRYDEYLANRWGGNNDREN